MTFLLDENFPRTVGELLSRRGHRWTCPAKEGLIGAGDLHFVEKAQALQATILTTDRDFFHTLHHRYTEHSGLIVIALRQPNRHTIIERLTWLLDHIDEKEIPNRAFQLRDRTWAAQPPLSTEE